MILIVLMLFCALVATASGVYMLFSKAVTVRHVFLTALLSKVGLKMLDSVFSSKVILWTDVVVFTTLFVGIVLNIIVLARER